MKKVCVVGLGYIGLPTAALLANNRFNVLGVDVVEETVEIVNRGGIHIIEKDLEKYVKKAVENGSLVASTKPDVADVFIIAVPTPFKNNFEPDLKYVIEATISISSFVKKNNLIILESTSPVGTTQIVKNTLKENGVDVSNIFIAHCPERVLPGNIIKELTENDRIVGGIDKASTKKAVDFYKCFVSGKVFETDDRTAELAKLTENSFRDVNIAFANELSIICDNLGIDVRELIGLTNKHPRVDILSPGAGVGGHCIAVDPWFIIDADKKNSRLIKLARKRNLEKTSWVINKINQKAKDFESTNKRNPKIACMGLAFKPNIDDLRESPALQIVKSLILEGHDIIAVEPNIKSHSDIKLSSIENAVKNADIITFLVGHDEFKNLNLITDLDFCGILNKGVE
tara:strand:+ start:12086 stop:13285 length:1200 start_codon:yes stop_codon:yes gene_type:complete